MNNKIISFTTRFSHKYEDTNDKYELRIQCNTILIWKEKWDRKVVAKPKEASEENKTASADDFVGPKKNLGLWAQQNLKHGRPTKFGGEKGFQNRNPQTHLSSFN